VSGSTNIVPDSSGCFFSTDFLHTASSRIRRSSGRCAGGAGRAATIARDAEHRLVFHGLLLLGHWEFKLTNGGVILIGVYEEPASVLKGYVPGIDRARADEIMAQCRRARSLCSPQPVLDAKAIERTPGNYVVAVNVDAYAAPPIGAHMKSQGGDRPRWWAYPARRGTDNIPLRPEELATIMDPRLRRIALQLERLPKDSSRQLSAPFFCFENRIHNENFWILEIDHEAVALKLESVQNAGFLLFLPLHAVDLIWREDDARHRGSWNLSVRGKLLRDRNLYQYDPNPR
jgi:hypothetical protein